MKLEKLIFLVGLLLNTACAAVQPPVVEAVYTGIVPQIDGVPDEGVWASAKGYPLVLSFDKEGELTAAAEVKFAWNKHGLYLAARMDDADLIANNDQDQQYHQICGDVLELFVKPKSDSYYWEMYVTPRGNKTTLFWFRSISRKIFTDPLSGHDFQGLEVGAQAKGVVNDFAQTDTGWTAEMWVPATELKHFGEEWGSGTNWTVLIGRYNYGAGLENPENTMFPALSQTWYHLTAEYADLRFLGE